MNLITFNIDDKLINNKDQKFLDGKKNLLFSYACQHNKTFQKKSKNKIAKVFNFKNNLALAKNCKYLDKVYDEILQHLKIYLNKFHKKNYSKHYWEILIGKWLRTLVHQTFASWKLLEKIEKKYKINYFYKISLKNNIFIPENTWHSHILIRNAKHKYNLFHHWLLTKMIEERNVRTIKLRLKNNLRIEKKVSKLNRPNKYQNIFHKSLNNNLFYYLWDVPREIKIKTMKHFKFINVFLNLKAMKVSDSQIFNREKIFNKNKNKGSYKSFLKKIIKYTLPKIYLENYNSLKINYKKLNWPKNPKYILTSYPYYDELFKYYCAQKYESGSKILLTQHGSDNMYKYDNWYVNKIYPNQLCWGENKKKGLYSFLFTKNFIENKSSFIFNDNKKIILILYAFTEMENKVPEGYFGNMSANERIFNLTCKYLNSLTKNLRKKNVIKTLELTRYPVLEKSLKEEFKNLKSIKINEPFKRVIHQYNLSVHFYLGTPFFESIYLNKPTILIFDEKVNFRLNEKFSYYLQKFKDAKICFESPTKAANFINKNYKNLEAWWMSSEKQIVLNNFKEDFCRHPKNLKNIFYKISKI